MKDKIAQIQDKIKLSKKEWDDIGTNCDYPNYPELKAELKGILTARDEIIKMIDEEIKDNENLIRNTKDMEETNHAFWRAYNQQLEKLKEKIK